MQVQYLEIVTDSVEAICAAYSEIHRVTFSAPNPSLGNGRTTSLKDGTILAVRAPLNETETPTVRPYWLVEDIQLAVDAAVKAGAKIIHSPLEIPGVGTFAIYVLGSIEHGLLQK